MGISAAIFYIIVIACPIVYGIRKLIQFIIKQIQAQKAWKKSYEEYEATHEEELYWRVKRKLDEPAERRRYKRNIDYFWEEVSWVVLIIVFGVPFLFCHKGIFGFCLGIMFFMSLFGWIATMIECKKYRIENHKKWYD